MSDVSEQFQRANLAGVERAEALARLAFGAFERLAALNLAHCRLSLANREADCRGFAGLSNPQGLFSLQARSVREQSRQAADYAGRVIAISRETGDELARTMGSGVELSAHFAEAA